MGKHYKSMNSKIFKFSTMQNKRIQYYKRAYMRAFIDLEKQRQLHYEPAGRKDTKTGRSTKVVDS